MPPIQSPLRLDDDGDTHELLRPAGRAYEIGAGIVLVPFALALAAFGLLILVSALSDAAAGRNWQGAIVLGAIFFACGAGLVVISYCLIVNRARSDGGLFAPAALRIAGVLFALLPLIMLWLALVAREKWSWLLLLKVAGSFAWAAACFHLAARRARQPRAPDAPIH